jgi:membrane associated rhomboid family serine protease
VLDVIKIGNQSLPECISLTLAASRIALEIDMLFTFKDVPDNGFSVASCCHAGGAIVGLLSAVVLENCVVNEEVLEDDDD